MQIIIATGIAGFIGSAFLRTSNAMNNRIIGVDKLTYAGHLANLEGINPNYFEFIRGDICDKSFLSQLIHRYKPSAIVNFAAESHVDNSISGPQEFINTNIVGVFNLLEASRDYWHKLSNEEKKDFRFLQISTDEVYGALESKAPRFHEETPYAPNSPYSASKAAGDHLVRAWFHTFGLPTIITNCSNNYGPRQFPEKLIPRIILNALNERALPVYGSGQNIRDWIHVEDHCRGIWAALTKGIPGQSYCFGGNSERTNINVVETLCDLLQKKRPRSEGTYRDLIKFVEDRAGHDFRYAIDDSKSQRELGYKREFSCFEAGLEATVNWYLQNDQWIKAVTSKV